jgi:pilus assembly protein CpaF
MSSFDDAKRVHDEIMDTLSKNQVGDLRLVSEMAEHQDLNKVFDAELKRRFQNESDPLRSRLYAEFLGAGPLADLLNDPDITEILINGPHHVLYEKYGKLFVHDDSFFTNLSYQNFLNRLCLESHIEAHLDRPFANGNWRGFRVHLIIPPLAKDGSHLSLRRHPEDPWTFDKLMEKNWARTDGIELLDKMLREHWSFLIVGSTGCGKTSALNACMKQLPENDRIITIEDTSELVQPNKVSTRLLTRDLASGTLTAYTQEHLVKQALRMRPDRIVVGEVRGGEAKDLLLALATGHKGSMGTLHADNARQAVYRLEMLIQMGAPQWTSAMVRRLIFFGLNAIVCVEKKDGVRRLSHILKISSLEETGFCFDTLYQHDESATGSSFWA